MDKILFNKVFGEFVGRGWIDLRYADRDEIDAFLKSNPHLILKPNGGNSGIGIEAYDYDGDTDKFCSYVKDKFDLAEERVSNHDDIAVFNKSSLNTVRIVTFGIGDKIKYLYAGLRVGAPGSVMDNISRGGGVSTIDIESGKLVTGFHAKKNSAEDGTLQSEKYIGYQLPMWEELLEFVKQASKIVPEVKYIAWDVGITSKGLCLIEGNNSFGSVIMQTHLSNDEKGLKDTLMGMILEK